MSPPDTKGPALTVDIIIELDGRGIVLIERRNPPFGWAIPGGYVEYGETAEEAAIREAREETGLEIELQRQFQTYSDPSRNPITHTVSVVFIAKASGEPKADTDALDARVCTIDDLPEPIVFDHPEILDDYFRGRY